MTAEGPVSFAEARKGLQTVADRGKLGTMLRRCATAVERDQMAAGKPYSVLVVILTDGVPEVVTKGIHSWQDLTDAKMALSAYTQSLRDRARGDETTPATAVANDFRRRRGYLEEQRQKKLEYELEHPWSCEYCSKRYKTERGAKGHESKCWRNPNAQRYHEGGGFIPLQVRDGIAHGWSIKLAADSAEVKPKTEP